MEALSNLLVDLRVINLRPTVCWALELLRHGALRHSLNSGRMPPHHHHELDLRAEDSGREHGTWRGLGFRV